MNNILKNKETIFLENMSPLTEKIMPLTLFWQIATFFVYFCSRNS